MRSIVTITGPSGSGKSTLERILTERGFSKPAVSLTSRKPREGEIDGVNYYFVEREALERMEQQGELIEHTYHSGSMYGLASAELERIYLMEPHVATLVCDPVGVKHIREYAARMGVRHVSVFCATPGALCLQRVMRERPDRAKFLIETELRWPIWADDKRCLYDFVCPSVEAGYQFDNWLKAFMSRALASPSTYSFNWALGTTNDDKHKASLGVLCPECWVTDSYIRITGCNPDGVNTNTGYECSACGAKWEGY